MNLISNIVILATNFLLVGGQQQSCQDFISTGDGAGVTGGQWSCDHPTGKPYYFGDDEDDFDTVRAECQALPPFNGRPFDVVVIETQEELGFIVNNPEYGGSDDRYIGLKAETLSNPPVPSDFKWINGAPLTLDIFFDDNPSSSDSVPRCVALDKDPIKLEDQRCSKNEDVICEVSIPSVPPSVASEACEKVKTRYFQIDEDNQQLSWEDAQAACMEKNAHLITVKSHKENLCAFVKYQTSFRSLDAFWLGLVNDLEEKKKFRWIDNDLSPYRNWCGGVTPTPGSVGCVLFRFGDPFGATTGCFELVADCSTPHSFVCEANTLCDKNGFQTLAQAMSKTIQGTQNNCKSCRK
ncbi:macrophage mannose receptor 1-like [Clytia hemisphaerica]|uniref:macrophage mannose receptor 1-like n=1 Tax=Clytia hemisphaerica TaxID=252671 RepID=UPI0034D4F20D